MDKHKGKQIDEVVNLFTKEQLLRSKRYNDKKDILNAVLKDDKTYKLSDVDAMIEQFLNKEVL